MTKKAGRVIELKLDGTLSSGLEVNLSISWEEKPRDLEASARLMPALQIDKIHKNWQTKYRKLGSNQRIITAQEIRYDDCFEKRKSECISLSKQLKKELNNWLKAPDFQPLRRLIERVETSERVRILIRTNNEQLRRLPWNLWELLEKYPEAEIALAANNYEKIDLNPDSSHGKNYLF